MLLDRPSVRHPALWPCFPGLLIDEPVSSLFYVMLGKESSLTENITVEGKKRMARSGPATSVVRACLTRFTAIAYLSL